MCLTAIAVTKLFCGAFRKPNTRHRTFDDIQETIVCTKRMTGIIHNSINFSLDSCAASFEKTRKVSMRIRKTNPVLRHTETWGEEEDVEIGDSLLRLATEVSFTGSDEPESRYEDDLHDCFRYQASQI